MPLSTTIKADVKNVLLNASDFAESITYDPGGAENKAISAVIVREQSIQEEDLSGTKMLIHRATILISTDATDGIASPSQTKTVSFDSKAWAIDTLQLDGIASAQLGVIHTEKLTTGSIGV